MIKYSCMGLVMRGAIMKFMKLFVAVSVTLLMLFSLIGCGSKKTISHDEMLKLQKESYTVVLDSEEDLELTNFVFSAGGGMAAVPNSYKIQVVKLADGYYFSNDWEKYYKASDAEVKLFLNILDKYNIYKIKEIKSDDFVLDGMDFYLEYWLSDGTRVTDSGQFDNIPYGYPFLEELDDLVDMGFKVK